MAFRIIIFLILMAPHRSMSEESVVIQGKTISLRNTEKTCELLVNGKATETLRIQPPCKFGMQYKKKGVYAEKYGKDSLLLVTSFKKLDKKNCQSGEQAIIILENGRVFGSYLAFAGTGTECDEPRDDAEPDDFRLYYLETQTKGRAEIRRKRIEELKSGKGFSVDRTAEINYLEDLPATNIDGH